MQRRPFCDDRSWLGIRNSALHKWEQRSPCSSLEFPTPSPCQAVWIVFRLGREKAKRFRSEKGFRIESVGLEGFSAGLVAKPTSGCAHQFFLQFGGGFSGF